MSDPDRVIASPLPSIPNQGALQRIKSVVEAEAVTEVVVGLPLHMDGSMSEMAEEVMVFVSELRTMLNVPVLTRDERLSTVEAERALNAADASSRRRRRDKGRIDSASAAIILQSHLDTTL